MPGGWSRRRGPSAIAEPPPDPDRRLALAHAPAGVRPALAALLAIDQAMARTVAASSEPMIGAIRLAWWREELEKLDRQAPAPAEPRLAAAARELVPRAVTGAELARLEEGWRHLFDDFPWGRHTAAAITGRGQLLFALAARLLGGDERAACPAGSAWALVDAARHCSDAASRTLLLEEARAAGAALRGRRFERRLRPLTMLAAAALRDLARGEPFEPAGGRARALAMLRHRWTGRLARW